ncbi:MAG UNVERIFIED_CONTAM: MFS transporter, partial [Thermobifida fusca]
MGIARETSGIGRLILGVFNAAAFAGLSTVVLPLLLDQRGVTKPEIVIFYVLFALAAMAASLLGGGWCRRHGRYRTG